MSSYFLAENPFWSIQGEGLRTGEPTVFIRLAGCNVTSDFWCYEWCDTKFARTTKGALELTVADIVRLIAREPKAKWVCITGGEPLLQDLRPLSYELACRDFRIQVETNGTIEPPVGLLELVDHWTVSPKTPHVEEVYWGVAKEFKWVINEESDLERIQVPDSYWGQVFLQPMNNNPAAVNLCLDALKEHPRWRLSMQIHKILGVK